MVKTRDKQGCKLNGSITHFFCATTGACLKLSFFGISSIELCCETTEWLGKLRNNKGGFKREGWAKKLCEHVF